MFCSLPLARNRRLGFFACLIATSALAGPVWAQLQVTATVHGRMGDGPLHVYRGTVSLPADGLWNMRVPADTDAIRELYLLPTQPSLLRHLGKRMYAAWEEQAIQNSRWQLQGGFEACRQYAQEQGGVGPKSIAALADDKRWKYLADRWDKPHWRLNQFKGLVGDQPLKGPFLHLIPEVRFQFAKPPAPHGHGEQAAERQGRPHQAKVRKVVPKEKRAVLAFELRPFIDDGKHWVLYTDGQCERVAIDPELIQAQQVKIRPVFNSQQNQLALERPSLEYRLVLVASQPLADPLALQASNQVLGKTLEISWDTRDAAEGSYADLRQTITDARKFGWRPYLLAGSGGVLNVWDQSGRASRRAPDPRRNLTMFAILGGRAAIEETLQLQDLTVTDARKGA
nr:hypothetical protein [Planctomycetales bacterium]NIP67725.1 hypothetical protein [Planctomycetales bacterium]